MVKTWKNGKPWAEADRSTTGSAVKLIATAERAGIYADGQDLCYVTITIADEKGRLVPRSMDRLNFKIAGAGEIVAACNGDATSHEPMTGATTMQAFNGLCQVVLRGKKGKPGKMELTISSGNLAPAKVVVTSK